MNQLAFLRSIFCCYAEYPFHLHRVRVQPFPCKLDGSAMRPCDGDGCFSDGDGDVGRLFLVGFEEERRALGVAVVRTFVLGLSPPSRPTIVRDDIRSVVASRVGKYSARVKSTRPLSSPHVTASYEKPCFSHRSPQAFHSEISDCSSLRSGCLMS